MTSTETPDARHYTAEALRRALDGETLALLTRHGKEALLAPLFEPSLGCRLLHVDGIDTDALGTFTREVTRPGSQRDAAIQKARLGAELAGCRFAIASEGAFVTDPWTGMMPWNVEMVVLLDTLTGFQMAGLAQGLARSGHAEVRDREALLAFAAGAGFPAHRLVLRPDHQDHPAIRKGIGCETALLDHFEGSLRESTRGCVFVENDLRAHCNPTRQAIIVQAGRNLLDRIASACPVCAAPDFWVTGKVGGLPCRWCRQPTRVPSADRLTCHPCGHSEERPLSQDAFADPSRCEHCNP